jgi:hypothetical protein
MSRLRAQGTRAAIIFAAAATAAACAPSFDPPSLVESVRILGVRADLPYAAPGEKVTLQVLAVDGRHAPASPMRVFWLPDVCTNPQDDAYWRCYPAFAGKFAAGVDLSSALVPADTFAFTMPPDAIASAQAHPSANDTFGVAFAFVVACAGHVEYAPPDPSAAGAAATPFGCYDEAHQALGADDFVFGFKRVFAFADRRNANPQITGVTYGGASVDATAGLTMPHCTASEEKNCSATGVDVEVPDSSWEVDPGSVGAGGGAAHEAIWVEYYATRGRFDKDTKQLFDAYAGRAGSTGDDFDAPLEPGAGTLWAVVQDNRGGASWMALPLQAN